MSDPPATEKADSPAPYTYVFMFGGTVGSTGDATIRARMYFPPLGTPVSIPSMPNPREDAVAVALGPEIVVLGGCRGRHGQHGERTHIMDIDVFNTITDTWTCDASLLDPTLGHAMGGRACPSAIAYDFMTSPDGGVPSRSTGVLVTGGFYIPYESGNVAQRKSCFVYFPSADVNARRVRHTDDEPQAEQPGEEDTARSAFSSDIPSEPLGEQPGEEDTARSAFSSDIPGGRFVRIADMKVSRVGHALVLFAGKPVVLGGVESPEYWYSRNEALREHLAEQYNDEADTWSPFPPPPLEHAYDSPKATVADRNGSPAIYMVVRDSLSVFDGKAWAQIATEPLDWIDCLFNLRDIIAAFSVERRCIAATDGVASEWYSVMDLPEGEILRGVAIAPSKFGLSLCI